MFRFNNRCIRCCSGVFIGSFKYIWRVVLEYFLLFWTYKWWIEYFIALSMPFRVESRSPVTCLLVTTVHNYFQPLPIFSHKELHLRCCIGLDHTFQPLRCPKWEVYNEPSVYMRWYHGCHQRKFWILAPLKARKMHSPGSLRT